MEKQIIPNEEFLARLDGMSEEIERAAKHRTILRQRLFAVLDSVKPEDEDSDDLRYDIQEKISELAGNLGLMFDGYSSQYRADQQLWENSNC